ncbi:GntR family transcriptional regulator [Desemzia sp. RIT804]|uniref:GntR family transcriptional regulator n=1 Tax=Desemzia sp. RIT 804 TaxID=2810209 RepID=UPI00194F01D7|nr:GntR family transcriptional regulator [Desemzia sp. RIT 804]MBM6615293.1 GntR family transcriptional regulator [Desemzia sp. RIT 804]
MKRTKLLYLEIADSIRKKILEGVYPINSMIPTETELEEEYSVSKITIRKAVELLVIDGYLEKRSGKGTKVISNRLFNNLSKARSFSSILESKGHLLKKEILSIEKIEIEEANKELYSLFGSEAFKLTRLYFLDDHPYIYFQHFLPALGNEKQLERLEKQSLYKWLASYGKQVTQFEDSFKVVEVSEEEKKILQTEKSHVLKRIRRAIDNENSVIELSFALYDTEKYPYIIDYEV